MSKKKQNNSQSSIGVAALIIGAVGFGIGALIGHFSSKLSKQENNQPKKVNVQPRKKVTNQQFHQTMQCPISRQIMIQPTTVSQCGHSFEKKIIVQSVQKYGKCPLCRKQTNIESLVPNFQLKQVIDKYNQTLRP